MPNTSSKQQDRQKESLAERVIDRFKGRPEDPPRPSTPAVNREEWSKSVDAKHIVPGLTVHDVGLSVYGETRSLHDRPGSNESIDTARQKIAHAMINDAELSHRIGKLRNSVHDPVEPKDKVLHNRDELAAYNSSLRAAREAYLSGNDPTNGATHLNSRRTPDRSNWDHRYPISTQSGPYDNSFVKGDQKSHTVWLNTYLPDENERKHHKKR